MAFGGLAGPPTKSCVFIALLLIPLVGMCNVLFIYFLIIACYCPDILIHVNGIVVAALILSFESLITTKQIIGPEKRSRSQTRVEVESD